MEHTDTTETGGCVQMLGQQSFGIRILSIAAVQINRNDHSWLAGDKLKKMALCLLLFD